MGRSVNANKTRSESTRKKTNNSSSLKLGVGALSDHTSMASLCTAAALPHSTSTVPRSLSPVRTQAREITSTSSLPSFCYLSMRRPSVNRTSCFRLKSKNQEETEGEGSDDTLTDALFSSVRNDSEYLWKLAAGSVGGASAIKYGSIFLPDITRPNIIQGLLMVSLPVVVAVLILLKESYWERQDEDQI